MDRTGVASRFADELLPPVRTINADGASPFVLVCDHASNRIPQNFDGLGLSAVDRLRHIAWDPGALAVSLQLVELLDAPLVHSTISRLVIDCNRTFAAPGLIAEISETTEVPGNRELGDNERGRRIADFYLPYHQAIENLLNRRAAQGQGQETILIAMHSFTPIFNGVARPWPVGLVHGIDDGFSRRVFEALKQAEPELNVGWNEPYASLNAVTYTLEHHGDERGLVSTMFEIRHDEILEPDGVGHWASLLARCLEQARVASRPAE